MQKKVIALAVASLASGSALAQTNVTIYGVADAGYVYSWGDPGKLAGQNFQVNPVNPATGSSNIKGTNVFSGVQSGLLSGSRLGFKGEEALGNGLKAIFTLEYALDIDSNYGVGASASGLNARQQFVGLSSASLGTVSLGRQYAPGYQASINNAAFGSALFSPQNFLTANAGNTITPGGGARWNNAITYTSPNFSGFSAKGIYSFGENNKGGSFLGGTGVGAGVSTIDNSRYGLGFNFATGPVNVDLVYQVRQDVQTGVILPAAATAASNFPANETQVLGFAPNGKDINEWYVGGSLDLKVVKLTASWQGQNDKSRANLDNQTWQIGAVIPILSASNIHLSYAQQLWDQGSYYSRTGIPPVAGQSALLTRQGNLLNQNTDAFAIGWTTALSKRTTLYTGYVWANNDRNSLANGPLASLPVSAARDEQNQTFLAGINHTF